MQENARKGGGKPRPYGQQSSGALVSKHKYGRKRVSTAVKDGIPVQCVGFPDDHADAQPLWNGTDCLNEGRIKLNLTLWGQQIRAGQERLIWRLNGLALSGHAPEHPEREADEKGVVHENIAATKRVGVNCTEGASAQGIRSVGVNSCAVERRRLVTAFAGTREVIESKTCSIPLLFDEGRN